MNAHENDKPGREEIENALIDFGISLLRHRLLSPSTSFQLQSLPAAVDNAYQTLKIDCEKLSPENHVQLIFQALTDPQTTKPTLLPITELFLTALETPQTIDNLVAALQNAFDSLPAGGGRFGTFGYLMSYFGSRVALGAPDHPTLSVATYWKVLAAAAFAAKNDKVLLFSGDIAGLEEFMRVKTSKQAAKNMRARSFYVQMLSQVLARTILRELDLPLCNLLFEGASRFLLALPTIEARLNPLLTEISRRLLILHGTAPALQSGIQVVPLAELFDHRPHVQGRTAYQEHAEALHAQTSRSKNRQLKHMLSANPRNLDLVYQHLFHERNGRERDECKWCGVELTDSEIRHNQVGEDDEEALRCSQCLHFGWTASGRLGLAQEIAHARFLQIQSSLPVGTSLHTFRPDIAQLFAESSWYPECATNAPTWRECLGYLGYEYIFHHRLPDVAESELLVLNPGWQGQNFHATLQRFTTCRAAIGFRFAGIATPFDEENGEIRVRDTHEFCTGALVPEASGEGKIGSALYGVLRLDGDGMGALFGQCPTLSETLALNEQTSLFFEGWINHYCQETMLLELPSTAQSVYCLFAGGDDILIAGPWLVLPLLALNISEGYARFVVRGNPKWAGGLPEPSVLHLSAGIALEKELFPLYQLEAFAHDHLDTSKQATTNIEFLSRQHRGQAATFLGQTLHWRDFRHAQQLAQRLDDLIRGRGLPKPAPRSLLRRLRLINMQYEKDLQIAWENSKNDAAKRLELESGCGWLIGKWLWRASYTLQQAIAEAEAELQPELSTIREQLIHASTSLTPSTPPISFLRMAAQWADLLSRKEKDHGNSTR